MKPTMVGEGGGAEGGCGGEGEDDGGGVEGGEDNGGGEDASVEESSATPMSRVAPFLIRMAPPGSTRTVVVASASTPGERESARTQSSSFSMVGSGKTESPCVGAAQSRQASAKKFSGFVNLCRTGAADAADIHVATGLSCTTGRRSCRQL